MSIIARETIGNGLPGGLNGSAAAPEQAIVNIFQFVITLVFVGGGLMVAYYFIYGAFNWLTSQGDKEKIDKARKMMTNAAIGLVILFCSIALWVLVVGNIFGIVKPENGGFVIKLPTLFNQ